MLLFVIYFAIIPRRTLNQLVPSQKLTRIPGSAGDVLERSTELRSQSFHSQLVALRKMNAFQVNSAPVSLLGKSSKKNVQSQNSITRINSPLSKFKAGVDSSKLRLEDPWKKATVKIAEKLNAANNVRSVLQTINAKPSAASAARIKPVDAPKFA